MGIKHTDIRLKHQAMAHLNELDAARKLACAFIDLVNGDCLQGVYDKAIAEFRESYLVTQSINTVLNNMMRLPEENNGKDG